MYRILNVRNLLLNICCMTLLSCSFTQTVKTGEMAYERKQYAIAIDLLEKEYLKTTSEAQKARKSYLLGMSYRKILDYDQAGKWFGNAVNNNYGVDAMMQQALVLRQLEDYEAAIGIYRKIADITQRRQETDKEIANCNYAIELKSNPKPYKTDRISQNTTVSEYAPVIYDNQFLVFTSERKQSTGSQVYKWTGEKYSDLFVMMKSGSDVRIFDPMINTEANEGAACFSQDMQTMYFTRCFADYNEDAHCKIMVTHMIDGSWSEPEALPFVHDKVNYGQPALFEQDQVLIFVADMEDPGGNTDLYYTEILQDGSFTAPAKLPSRINSPGNEKFPTTFADTLYFSSDYLPGMGGYDIFKTWLLSDGSWSIPVNMGAPVNSGADDFSFIVDPQPKPGNGILKEGFFVSSRAGNGKDDIYRFKELVPVVKEPEKTEEIKRNVFITVHTLTSVYNIEEDPNSGVKGNIPLGFCLVNMLDEEGKRMESKTNDANGFIVYEVPENRDITIVGAKSGYLNAIYKLSTHNLKFDTITHAATVNIKLTLNKIYEDKEIILDNIYYDYDKWDIKSEAKPALNYLVRIMLDNPQIKIQLSSHTDCRGEDSYNQELSQKRAQSVVDYLISKDIPASRLVAKGYGASQLLESCICEKCTEQQHQRNRRTTFKIIK